MKLGENGELTVKQLTKIQGYLNTAAQTYATYQRYYSGDNPTIIDAADKPEPDNRVPCNFAGKIVDTFKGYMFPPGKIKYSSNGEYAGKLKETVFDPNDEELLTAEIATDALSTGRGFEVLRVDSAAKNIKLYRIDPLTGYAVYDDTLDHNMIAFVHIVSMENDDATKEYIKTVYYADKWIEYRGAVDSWTETDRKDHPFGEVSAIEYKPNSLGVPIFKGVIYQIDEHDKIISSSYANERDRFADAYIRMLKTIDTVTKDENGQTDADKIKSIRMFSGLGDGGDITNVSQAVDFMVKPDRGSSVAESADRFERLIYELSMCLNPTDTKTTNAGLSGYAQRLKAWAMELKAADIEANFSKGLQRRLRLIANAKEITGLAPEQVTIKWDRNIPADLESLMEIAGGLKGLLSDETILKLFPADIVPDVKAELDRLAEQASARLPDETNVDDALIPDDQNAAAETGDIQATALNGAQIRSLVEVVSSVTRGELPMDSAIAIISSAFPLMSPVQIAAIFASIKQGSKPETPNAE